MMKIVIDYRMCNHTGIGEYVKNIVPYLLEDFKVVLICSNKDDYKTNSKIRVEIVEFKSKIYTIAEQLEFIFKIPQCDLFWSPHYNIPILKIKARKRIVTIHDVLHLAFAEELNFIKRNYSKILINRAVKLSNCVITVSEFSKREIQKYTGCVADYVVGCASNGIKIKKNYDNNRIVKEKYFIPDDFVLFVGNVKKHKNIQIVIEAIKDLNINLVIVGKFDKKDKDVIDLKKRIRKYGLDKNIIFTGYVSDCDLQCIYALSKIFIFPSMYEGFGIPPIEAQLFGVPVICSDIEPLKEHIDEGSVLFFKNGSSDSLKRKIEELNNNLSLKEALIENGYKNARKLNWKDRAEVIKNILNSLKED